MNKLVKNVNTLTVQSGTNGGCYCTYPCGSQVTNAGLNHAAIQRDSSRLGIGTYSTGENE